MLGRPGPTHCFPIHTDPSLLNLLPTALSLHITTGTALAKITDDFNIANPMVHSSSHVAGLLVVLGEHNPSLLFV